jgi:hypothetical protein
MRSEELILAVVLALIIVADFRYPDYANDAIKSPIGLVLVLAAVLYLFTKSSILGILGLIAGFLMVQRAGSFAPKYSANGTSFSVPMNDPPMATSVTLEETVIGNMIPVTNSPGSATYTNSFSDVRNAANAFS